MDPLTAFNLMSEFSHDAFKVFTSFTILQPSTSITVKKYHISRRFEITSTDMNDFELPSEHYKEMNKKVIKDALSDHCESSLIDSNVVSIITDYCPSSSLDNCPYFWFNQRKYDVLKQEMIDGQIEIVAKAKYPHFVFLRQFDENTIFIGEIRGTPFYNFIGLIYNEIYEKLLSDYDDNAQYPDFSWMDTFVSWLKTQPFRAFPLQS